jgi:hypothetical protein
MTVASAVPSPGAGGALASQPSVAQSLAEKELRPEIDAQAQSAVARVAAPTTATLGPILLSWFQKASLIKARAKLSSWVGDSTLPERGIRRRGLAQGQVRAARTPALFAQPSLREG